MKTSRIFAVLVLAGAGLLAGCNTPEARIQNSPDVFNRLPPDQQALVKQGKIAPGFDMEAVKLALGDPDRVVVHTDAQGQHQIWHYVIYQDSGGAIIYTGYYHRYWHVHGYWDGPYLWGGPAYWGSSPYGASVHDRIRVTFDPSNRVLSVEEETK